MKKNCVLRRNSGVSTPSFLAWKSEESPLLYCKIEADSEGNNQPGPLVRGKKKLALIKREFNMILLTLVCCCQEMVFVTQTT
jgi:hypothetical protein